MRIQLVELSNVNFKIMINNMLKWKIWTLLLTNEEFQEKCKNYISSNGNTRNKNVLLEMKNSLTVL